jgi:hypothetical protein
VSTRSTVLGSTARDVAPLSSLPPDPSTPSSAPARDECFAASSSGAGPSAPVLADVIRVSLAQASARAMAAIRSGSDAGASAGSDGHRGAVGPGVTHTSRARSRAHPLAEHAAPVRAFGAPTRMDGLMSQGRALAMRACNANSMLPDERVVHLRSDAAGRAGILCGRTRRAFDGAGSKSCSKGWRRAALHDRTARSHRTTAPHHRTAPPHRTAAPRPPQRRSSVTQRSSASSAVSSGVNTRGATGPSVAASWPGGCTTTRSRRSAAPSPKCSSGALPPR